MAEAVVDVLEVVEVEEENAERIGSALSQESVLQPVPEQRPVGELRQRIVEGAMRELALEFLPLGDVPGVDHEAADGRVVAEVGHDRLDVPRASVGVADTSLDRLSLPRQQTAPRR